MKFFLLVVALAQAVSAGNVGVRTSPLLAPAGVTYVDGSYHAGLAAGPVAYSAQPVFQSAVAAAPAVAVASQPVVQAAAAPVAYAAPATKYAAVPTVEHVQGVADVPVTRIEAQPAVIQKTVDVARPAVKTQRYEVRRPAIQKQFYDIEERVVVRPAGSAVVELDEPLSRTQKGPSVIRPTGDGVAVTSSVAVPTVSAELPSVEINFARNNFVGAGSVISGVSPSPAVGISVGKGSYIPAPVGPTISSVTPAPTAGVTFGRNPTSNVVAPPAPPQSADVAYGRSSLVAAAPSITSVSSAPSVELGYGARSSYAAAPAVAAAPSITSVSPAPSVELGYSARSSYAAAPAVAAAPSITSVSPAPSVELGYSARSSYAAAPAVAAAPSITSVSPAPSVELGYAARSSYAAAPAITSVSPAPSVGVSLARSSFAAAPIQTATYTGAAVAPIQANYATAYAAPSVSVSAVPVKHISVSSPVHVSGPVSVAGPIHGGVSSVSVGTSGVSSVPVGVSGITVSSPAPPQFEQQIVQSTPTPDYSEDSVSIDSADFAAARSAAAPRQGYQTSPLARSGPQTFAAPAPAPTRETIFRSELPPRRFTGQSSAAARSSFIVNYPNSVDLIPQQGFRAAAPVYERSSELSQENQQKLIQLLTARGGVTEVGFGRSGSASYPVDAGEVRARVVSATPAPAYSAPAGERVNTRRVVVSRPIETLQEVEVSEPVTKYERVQVDQPTLIKTARQDVVRVPTSVPVYGKALAPIAEAPVAYSAGWR